MSLVAYITNAGSSLIAQCAETGLEFTGAKISDGGTQGTMTDEQYATWCKSRTALDNTTDQVNASIGKVKTQSGNAKVDVQYTNASQVGDLTVQEIGIFARQRGSTGSSTLVCYCNFRTVDDADKISAPSAAMFVRIYEVIIAISNVAEITVTEQQDAFQEMITSEGLLIGEGNGSVTSVSADYYALSTHTHGLATASITGTLPISKGGTNATTAAQALTNLGIIYSATQPTYQAGAIWLQPVTE